MDVRVGLRGASPDGPAETVFWALNRGVGQPERTMGFGSLPVFTGDYCAPGHFQKLSINGLTYEQGIPFYNYGAVNVAQVPVGSDSSTAVLESMEITFHYEPVAIVTFDLTDQVPEIQRRVLIHKYGQDDTYFSSAQEALRNTPEGADGRVEIRGRVENGDGAALGNQKIYLRAGDPPDTAVYVPVGERGAGDNSVAGGGRFEEKNSEGETVLAKTTSIVSDSDGRFRVIFHVSNHVAGDNYRIEASTLSDFGKTTTCGPANGCFASGTLVAWKRAPGGGTDVPPRLVPS